MCFFFQVPRNALGRHLQLCLESHLNMACKKLQSVENEFTIANARLEELESSTAGNYNIEELHSTVSDNVDRISEIEASLATSKLEIAESNKKIKLLENLNIRKQQEFDELIERNRRISEESRSCKEKASRTFWPIRKCNRRTSWSFKTFKTTDDTYTYRATISAARDKARIAPWASDKKLSLHTTTAH